MSWFLLAIIGHLANGVAFAIDKILLRSAFSRSATYAGLVGVLSFAVVAAIPFVSIWPQGSQWFTSFICGATFVFALWAFFAALARSEASRVVPIVGSLIPIFTLAGSFTFLAERLSDKTFFGFSILILATILLSGGKSGKPSRQTVWLAVTSAVLFAVSSVAGKSIYEGAGFLGGLISSRIFAAMTAAFILFVIDREAGREALMVIRPGKERNTSKHTKQPGRLAALLALGGQALGSIGFILVQLAIAQGSPSVVNAMQAVQYALLVGLALILKERAPQLMGEHVTRESMIRKGIALGLTVAGMYLII